MVQNIGVIQVQRLGAIDKRRVLDLFLEVEMVVFLRIGVGVVRDFIVLGGGEPGGGLDDHGGLGVEVL